jgi:hypothetical protein
MDGERGETEERLTARSWARLGKPENDRGGQISPETGQEEVDVVVVVVDPGSIP